MGIKISPIIHNHFVQEMLPAQYPTCRQGYGKRTKSYVDMVATFDIEVTSTYTADGDPIAFMYCWQFYFNGHVIRGRTWPEVQDLIQRITNHFAPDILPIYIHYEGFEFSHMAHIFDWETVFCTGPRNPIKATIKGQCVEFRDSLILAGMGLDKLPTKTHKLKGDLDYKLIRHSGTPLTAQEIRYCINDVVVLAEWITDRLGQDDMGTIPMTRTGYVRRDVRKTMIKAKQRPCNMRMTPEEFEFLRQLYMGGFTHAAAHAAFHIHKHVRSLDITSSYPTVLCAELFPMESFNPYTPTDQADLERILEDYACAFRAQFLNIRSKPDVFEHIISESKCLDLMNQEVDNGRISRAAYLEIYLNEIDLFDVMQFYDFDDLVISDMMIAKKARLPRSLVERILYYYANKTKLKGEEGILDDGSDAETMYKLMKEYVNGIYGCFVTDPCKPEITFRNMSWETSEPDVATMIDKHNRSRNRWSFYPWGVWCTSYARHNLFTMMLCCGPDYLYSDTDSLKILNYAAHKDDFDAYNDEIKEKLRRACEDLNIPVDMAIPVKDGKEYPLGVWTDEGEYYRFKTLGAKRYFTSRKHPKGREYGFSATVAGAPKKPLLKYLTSRGEDPFYVFEAGLEVPPEHSGKNLHQYTKEHRDVLITDYTGRSQMVHCFPDACHISATTVSMDMAEKYAEYMMMNLGSDIVEIRP